MTKFYSFHIFILAILMGQTAILFNPEAFIALIISSIFLRGNGVVSGGQVVYLCAGFCLHISYSTLCPNGGHMPCFCVLPPSVFLRISNKIACSNVQKKKKGGNGVKMFVGERNLLEWFILQITSIYTSLCQELI